MIHANRFTLAGPARTATALLLTAACATASAIDFPTRRAGLWQVSIESDARPAMVAKHCVDEATDLQMQKMGQEMGGECKRGELLREGDALVTSSVCKMGKTTLTSKSRTTGDFKSTIRTEVDAKFDPPMAGRTNSKTVVNGKWVGPCPAGMKPGDMEMPGGMKMNVNDMMKGAGQARPPAK